MQNIHSQLLKEIEEQNFKSIARAITIIENNLDGWENILEKLTASNKKVIGITGPPGAGKSTLVNSLINEILNEKNKTVAILAIDPTSPFNFGSILGDRIRMSEFFNNQRVYIRSLATRGSLGGLSAKTIEITDVLKHAQFDYIIVETVGVGQSEIEITGLADATILVLVPEAGDDVQSIKSGIMEIADIFVVNKADRTGANTFIKNLMPVLTKFSNGTHLKREVVKTIATKNEGAKELLTAIKNQLQHSENNKEKKIHLMTEKAYELIRNSKMKGITKKLIFDEIASQIENVNFNLYNFIKKFY